jgi:hypothetical protein
MFSTLPDQAIPEATAPARGGLSRDVITDIAGFDARISAIENFYLSKNLPNERFPFVASVFALHPEWNVLHENPNLYDAVSVLQGARPVGLFCFRAVTKEGPFGDYLLKRYQERGLAVRESPVGHDIIAGQSAHVDRVFEILRTRPKTGTLPTHYHQALGETLGYAPASIECFITRFCSDDPSL